MAQHATDNRKLSRALAHWRTSHNVTESARRAGVSRSVLYRAIQREQSKGTTHKRMPMPRNAGTDTAAADALVDADEAGLDALIADIRSRMAKLPAVSPRYPSLAGVLAAALERRRRMRPGPPPDPSELDAQRRRDDKETLHRITQYVSQYERRGVETGVCIHWEQPLLSGAAATDVRRPAP